MGASVTQRSGGVRAPEQHAQQGLTLLVGLLPTVLLMGLPFLALSGLATHLDWAGGEEVFEEVHEALANGLGLVALMHPLLVLAQSVLVVPLIAALTRRLLLASLAEGGDQLRSLGAGPAALALLLLVHLRYGVLTVLLTAFGRAHAAPLRRRRAPGASAGAARREPGGACR